MKDADAYVLVFDVEGTLIDCVPQTSKAGVRRWPSTPFIFPLTNCIGIPEWTRN